MCASYILDVFQVSGVSFQEVGIEWRKLRTHGDLEAVERKGRAKWITSIFGPNEAACTCMQMVSCLAIKSTERKVARVWKALLQAKGKTKPKLNDIHDAGN